MSYIKLREYAFSFLCLCVLLSMVKEIPCFCYIPDFSVFYVITFAIKYLIEEVIHIGNWFLDYNSF